MLKNHFSALLIVLLLWVTPVITIAQNGGWIQKANYGGVARTDPGGFSIGNYGYMGCGYNGAYLTDWWKYDPSTNTWTSIASYPGAGCYSPSYFSYNGLGYCGMGLKSTGTCSTDLWCYNPTTNTWSALASFPGTPRYDTPCFLIGHRVYFIAGSAGGPPYLQDVWMYDINSNTWTKKNNFPGGQLSGMLAFAIGNHGYCGAGWDGGTMHNAMYEYDTTSDSWTPIAPIPTRGNGLSGLPKGFLIGDKEYVPMGLDATWHSMPTGWAYDTISKAWCPFSHMGKATRSYAMVLCINNKGYMGVGTDSTGIWSGPFVDDFWEYDPSSTFAVTDTNLCANPSALFSGITSFDSTVTNISWNWTFASGTPTTSTSQYPSITYSVPGTYPVQLIVSSCAGSDTVNGTVQIIGSGASLHFNGNTSICAGQKDTLSVKSGGGTYTWSTGSTSSSIVVSPSTTTTYSVQVNNGGCTKDTTVSITVGSKLKIIINGPDTLCAGAPITLNASGGASYSYLWNTGATTSDIVVFPTTNTTYSVQVSNGFCLGDTNISIAVLASPVLSVTSTASSICSGSSSTITATGGANYIWSTGSTNASISVTPTITTTYSVLTSNGFCTKDTAVVITVNDKPDAAIAGAQTVCAGTDITLTASGGETYKWFPATGLNCTTCSKVIATPTIVTSYTLVALNGSCTDTATANIAVLPGPTGFACCGDTIAMGDTVALSVTATGATSYVWNPSSSLSCNSCTTTKAFPQFTTTYAVTMSDTDGCTRTDSVYIFVEGCSNIWIPNAFTPNGDGLNDVFAPKGVCMVSYTMYIFNRWGNLIYNTTNSRPWDGTVNNNGNIAQEDTYVYLITATDGFRKQHTIMGRVTLIK